jgi:hypothetical protein
MFYLKRLTMPKLRPYNSFPPLYTKEPKTLRGINE